MKKMLFTLMTLVLATGALAQELSTPGDTDGATNYNSAFANVTVESEYPGQVQFELPTLRFTLDPNSMTPGNTITLEVRVRNNSDRAITVSTVPDPAIIGTNLTMTGVDLPLAAGAAGWYPYTISIPDGQQFIDLMAVLPSKDAADSKPNDGLVEFDFQMVATGDTVTPDTNTQIGF